MMDEGCKCSCESRVENLEEAVRLLNLQVKNLVRGLGAIEDVKYQVEALQRRMDREIGQVRLSRRDNGARLSVCPQPATAVSVEEPPSTLEQPTPPQTPGSSTEKSAACGATSDYGTAGRPSAPPSYEDAIAESLLTSDEGPYKNIARSGSPSALEKAAENGYTTSVETLLKCGVSRDSDEINKALIVTGNLVILQMLLGAGADPNACDANKCSALHWAVQRGFQIIVEALLRAGANLEAQDKWGNTPLHVAAQRNQEEIVKVLLSAGASPLVRNSEGWKPSDLASSSDLKSLLSETCSYRIVARCRNPTALEEAAEKGYTSSVETLLRCGASSNREQINSALVMAGSLVILQMLLDAGADPNACDTNKCTALHWATQKGLEASVVTLLRAGATLEARDKWGNTPLHVAAQCDREDVAKVLLFFGASPQVRNNEGCKPLDLTNSFNLKSLLS